ncbi:isocitrate/isopropylmalate dehydrogenase family protein [Oceanomicrobium pacificus]|uniref:Isocitrate/isopropylmalate dehydrogenase family protein n=1 Tax=Oceanomicrobium pacificus TaxID=2692916 RepID=A0A6B0TYG4_9RHOB|nr:isocitrate/isopropylmalate family dehydrogenase [Oceanomicrobium pacificus]MXU66043.1 isocitrate/isopropylmalate dehydrogenase family protein [Oceanomicrobium pacificus]
MDLLVLPGDDIGPEITAVACRVLKRASDIHGLDLRFEQRAVGVAAHQSSGSTVPDSVLDAALKADGIILGPAGMTAYPEATTGWLNVPGTIRKRLDLYANIRPARSRAGIPGARAGLDVTIVRENTEGFYSDRNMFLGSGEFMPTEDVALSVRKITRQASHRIARVAFEMAKGENRPVTVVGKRHVLQVSDGLFMEEVRRVAADYPDIPLTEVDIDAMAADIYTRPEKFGIILISNMFGDILSNLAVALSGSLGLAASLNAGDGRAAANAGHGSAPDIAGRGIANPLGLVQSTILLVDWLGRTRDKPAFTQAAAQLHQAVDRVLATPDTRPGDLGGPAGTEAVGDALVAALEDLAG